jgi:hypothetical protein
MLSYTVDEDAGLVDLTVDGAITKEDYSKVRDAVDGVIARYGKVRVVETIRTLGPIDAAIWWQDMSWAFSNLSKVSRAAVVTDNGWIGPVTRAVGALLPSEIRVFPLLEVAAARAWVREE